MKVQLCWKTDITPEGKINITAMMDEKEALQIYKKRPTITEAYLRHFDKGRYIIHERLKP